MNINGIHNLDQLGSLDWSSKGKNCENIEYAKSTSSKGLPIPLAKSRCLPVFMHWA